MSGRECDVLVVGAGPAGIAAACRAAECGRSVLLADENPACGGQIWRADRSSAATPAAAEWLARLAASGVEILPGAAAFEADADAGVLRFEHQFETVEVHCRRLVLATGARELFLPFPGWTLPGVIGAGGLQALVKGGFPVAGRRVVVAGSGPLLLAAAGLLGLHGAKMLGVYEQTSFANLARFSLQLWTFPKKLLEAIRLAMAARGVHLRSGWWVASAGGAKAGLKWVKLTDGWRQTKVECDLLACGYGLRPNTELAQFIGCRISAGAVAVDEFQNTSVDGVLAAGEVTGIGGAELSLEEGSVAGYAAADEPDRARAHFAARARYQGFAAALERAFTLRQELKSAVTAETIVCRCEDVTAGRLDEFKSWKEAKLGSRCGMGACQGRTCGPAAEFLYGWGAGSVRPPVAPVRVGTLAGESDLR
jgi:NADPH-dependent 2,4-dienoyl-CoA reductase/sulfur reductase-like enzyme